VHPLLWTVLALVLARGGAWALTRLWEAIAVGPGYKAKVLCSAIFASGREIDPRRAEEISADSYLALRLFRTHVDRRAQSVTASFFGARPRTAIHRPSRGATLAGSSGALIPLRPPPAPRPLATPWTVATGSARLARVVETAFTEPAPRRLRRTRAVIVVRDGRIIAERYAPGFNAGTPLAGWSMTKSVLSALVGILVGDGRLALDQASLLPQWQAPDRRAAIRLEDLLRMRSGLRFSEVYEDLSSDVVTMLFNCDDAAKYAAGQPLDAAPGTTWSYSSGTTNILSSLIRRAVGDADYPDWPRRALFDPAGMESAILEADAAGTFVCSSFMLATARDWARFGQLFLQDGVLDGRRILPEGWVHFCTAPTRESGGIYGAHWWLGLKPEMGGESAAAVRLPRDAYFAIGHEGQTLTVVPSLQLVVVRLGLSIYIDAWNHAAFLADLQDAL
jgi:CubicO group peptidase (beta-lactamase class C family)